MKGRSERRRGIIFLTFLFISYLCWRLLQNSEGSSELPEENQNVMEWWKSSPLWVEDQKPHINPHKFGMLINNPKICDINEKIDLLIMVASAVKHEDRRNAIRQTWASNLNSFSAKLVFLLGQGRDRQSQIQSENTAYRDIIQEDFEVCYPKLIENNGMKSTLCFLSAIYKKFSIL